MTATSWFRFYPSDWRGDAKLQACSLAARGLWIDILCVMFEASPYGHLLIDGKPPSYYRIAQAVHADHRVIKNLMAELKNAGVFTGDITSEITSRRMVRDKLKSEQARELSKKRWGENRNAPFPYRKKEGPTKGSKKTKARHRWENDLLLLGTERHAEVMDAVAAQPELIERATKAEMRKPGSGVMVVVIGEKRLRETA